ncbi:MAG: NfeD family protein, partial [Candidatus Methanoperedens sp.]
LIGIIMLFAEFAMPGFVILFFGVGALLVALLLSFVDIHINLQIILFLIFSLLALFLLRKWLKSVFKGVLSGKDKMPKNSESFVGGKAIAQGEIVPGIAGKVEFHGTLWNAEAKEKIPSGSTVLIEKQDNLTLEVKLLK